MFKNLKMIIVFTSLDFSSNNTSTMLKDRYAQPQIREIHLFFTFINSVKMEKEKEMDGVV